MAEAAPAPVAIGLHGAEALPEVMVDSYNLESKDEDGFIGDRARKDAFYEALDKWRKSLGDDDPFGDEKSADIGKKQLDEFFSEGDPKAVAALIGAMEDFAQNLAWVIKRFLKLKSWEDTEHIVVGGGFRESRIGEIVIDRAGVLLRADDIKIDISPIRNHPDEAGLIGAVHLAPPWIFKGHDSILAIDIGGTNIRVGIVMLDDGKKSDSKDGKNGSKNGSKNGKAPDTHRAHVEHSELWRHGDEKVSRTEVIKETVKMLKSMIKRADKKKLSLAPFIGIGCPGIIEHEGTIDRGAQNLPGNWESEHFNLPTVLREAIPTIGDQETLVVMHNDAVVQGLSELPVMRKMKHWGVLTIGTGLGNARFSKRDIG